MSAAEETAVVRVQFNDEWIVRFHVKTLRELSQNVISHYYWGAGTSSGVQPKHVRLILPNGSELDDRTWNQYMDRLRSRKGALKREDMLLCFAKRLDYDTVESGRDTLDSDSSVSTMQIDNQPSKRAMISTNPEL
ncbi:hypothetical protein GUITHDRAFT_152905, partial [Guillardia theta CCMP2712]